MIEVPIVVNFVAITEPRSVNASIAAIATKAAIKAYSIMVTPDCFFFVVNVFIFLDLII